MPKTSILRIYSKKIPPKTQKVTAQKYTKYISAILKK